LPSWFASSLRRSETRARFSALVTPGMIASSSLESSNSLSLLSPSLSNLSNSSSRVLRFFSTWVARRASTSSASSFVLAWPRSAPFLHSLRKVTNSAQVTWPSPSMSTITWKYRCCSLVAAGITSVTSRASSFRSRVPFLSLSALSKRSLSFSW